MATVPMSREAAARGGDVVVRRTTGARWQRRGWSFATYVALLFFLLIFLLPFFWIWFSAFKSSIEIAMDPFGVPKEWLWGNFSRAWSVGRFDQYILNSIIYCATIVTGVVVLSCFAGYALASLALPAQNAILITFLLGLMVPFQSLMIPMYYLLRDLRMLETYFAFIVPGIAVGLPFGIFLMRGFFRGLPAEIGDAARLDGANEWQVFRQIMFPLSAPGVATLIVFQFMATWKSFLMPLIFVQRDDLRPVALGMMFFFGRFTADRAMIAAGVTIAMLPTVVLYLLLQRRFIEGMTAGALKA